MARVIETRDSRREVERIAYYIGQNRPSAAKKFLRAVRKTYQLLSEMPSLGTALEMDNPSLQGMRQFLVSQFRNYIIFYKPLEDGVVIYHVLDGRRDYMKLL